MAFTFFFRDQPILEAAATMLVAETLGRSRVRIWDAGCAMGPEPYTLLIMLAERMGKFGFLNLRLDAIDHDEGGDFGTIIKNGIYSEEQRIAVIAMYHESLAPGGLLVMEHTQKMPPALAGHFRQATPEAQIYRKEEVAMAKAA